MQNTEAGFHSRALPTQVYVNLQFTPLRFTPLCRTQRRDFTSILLKVVIRILNNRRRPHSGRDTQGPLLQCKNKLDPPRSVHPSHPHWKWNCLLSGNLALSTEKGESISCEFYEPKMKDDLHGLGPKVIHLGGLNCLKLKVRLKWSQTQESHRSKQKSLQKLTSVLCLKKFPQKYEFTVKNHKT